MPGVRPHMSGKRKPPVLNRLLLGWHLLRPAQRQKVWLSVAVT